MLVDVFMRGVLLAIDVDEKLSLVPGYSCARGFVLDTILGPAESLDYVSTTAPSSPPPRSS